MFQMKAQMAIMRREIDIEVDVGTPLQNLHLESLKVGWSIFILQQTLDILALITFTTAYPSIGLVLL